MSDDFLYATQPAVPDDLEGRIRRRLTRLGARGPEGRRLRARWLDRHRTAAVVVGLVVLAGCAAGLVRAGGFVFRQSAQPPETPAAGAMRVVQTVVALEEALAALSFPLSLPSWVPQGYEPSDRAMVTLPQEGAGLAEAWQLWLTWEGPGGGEILFLAFPATYYRDDALPFGPDSVEAIEINGRQAAAVRGNWAFDGSTWMPDAGGNVLWVLDETAYWLQSRTVRLEDLIRVAESMR